MFGRRKSLIGLDIGSRSIKAVELVKRGDQVVVAGCAMQRVAPGEEPRVVLREVLRKGGFRTRRTASAVAGRDVIVRFITMAEMDEEALLAQLPAEADKFIPFELSEMVLDGHALSGNSEPGRMRVILIAARRTLIDEHFRLLDEVQAVPHIVDVETFALVNAFALHRTVTGADETKTVALLDLGATKTHVNILQKGQSLFAREIALAGDQFTEALGRRLSLEAAQAEMLKVAPQERQVDVELALSDSYKALGSEVNASLDFFENQFDDTVADIYLSGGSAAAPGLAEALKKQLQRPVAVWNPLEALPFQDERQAAQFLPEAAKLAVAVGLASRLGGD